MAQESKTKTDFASPRGVISGNPGRRERRLTLGVQLPRR